MTHLHLGPQYLHWVWPTAGVLILKEHLLLGETISRTHASGWFSFLLEASTAGHLEGGREGIPWLCLPRDRENGTLIFPQRIWQLPEKLNNLVPKSNTS